MVVSQENAGQFSGDEGCSDGQFLLHRATWWDEEADMICCVVAMNQELFGGSRFIARVWSSGLGFRCELVVG
eukprot:3661533-Rhodomonas_salina.1